MAQIVFQSLGLQLIWIDTVIVELVEQKGLLIA